MQPATRGATGHQSQFGVDKGFLRTVDTDPVGLRPEDSALDLRRVEVAGVHKHSMEAAKQGLAVERGQVGGDFQYKVRHGVSAGLRGYGGGHFSAAPASPPAKCDESRPAGMNGVCETAGALAERGVRVALD